MGELTQGGMLAGDLFATAARCPINDRHGSSRGARRKRTLAPVTRGMVYGPSTPIRRMLRLHAVVDGVVDGVGLQRDTEHAQAQSDGMAVERMGCGLERRWGWSGHGGLGCPCFRHVPRCWCSLDARCSHYFHSSDASTNDRTTSDPTAAGAKGLQQQKIRDKPLTRTQTRQKKRELKLPTCRWRLRAA